jgi:uncharacterized protein (TIGR03382 family)
VSPVIDGHNRSDSPGNEATTGREIVRRAPTTLARRQPAAVTRPSGRRRIMVGAAVVIGRAATHEWTRNIARWLVRNTVLYAATGAWVLARRWWEARTNARYERLMRAAEAAGDYDRLTDWEQRAEQARERRHRRRMDWITAPLDVARTTAILIMCGIGFLIGLGTVLAIAHRDAAWLLTPTQKIVDSIAWIVWLLDVISTPATIALPVLALAGLWQVGRRHGSVPRWAASTGAREHPTVIVTPGGVAAALAHLGIPAMNRAVKDGWQVEFATPPVRVNGRGYQTTFSLPMGVTPEMIADKRDVLARNLVRAPLEVWPSAAERAGYVDLWVADQGATERQAPPYPLLHDGTADVFAGVPLGVSLRGEVIAPALPGANVAFGGVMGQGKSNAARVTMASAALDPIAELWVFVFANNGDFDAYRPRLTRYDRGVDDSTVAAAVEALRALYAEVGRREARLAELGAKKVTRSLAERYADLRPLVALFSECHELFGDPNHSREAADLAVQTMRRARKAAITLMFDTHRHAQTQSRRKSSNWSSSTPVSQSNRGGPTTDSSETAHSKQASVPPSCGWARTSGLPSLPAQPRNASRSSSGSTSKSTTTPDSTPLPTSSPVRWPTFTLPSRAPPATDEPIPLRPWSCEICSTTSPPSSTPTSGMRPRCPPPTSPLDCAAWPRTGRPTARSTDHTSAAISTSNTASKFRPPVASTPSIQSRLGMPSPAAMPPVAWMAHHESAEILDGQRTAERRSYVPWRQ